MQPARPWLHPRSLLCLARLCRRRRRQAAGARACFVSHLRRGGRRWSERCQQEAQFRTLTVCRCLQDLLLHMSKVYGWPSDLYEYLGVQFNCPSLYLRSRLLHLRGLRRQLLQWRCHLLHLLFHRARRPDRRDPRGKKRPRSTTSRGAARERLWTSLPATWKWSGL